MSQTSDSVKQELVLLAQRLGITLSDDELAVIVPICLRNRELLAKLREALPAQEEPVVYVPPISEGGRR
jgi:hypothetical protein